MSEANAVVDRQVRPVRRFSSMSEAFDYIRERNRPDIVEVEFDGTKDGKPIRSVDTWRLYPSGKAEQV